MDRWSGRIAVVTGAAGGIGAAVTKKLLQYDIVVVGLSFTEEKLEKLSCDISAESTSTAKFYPIRCDIRDEKNVVEAFAYVEQNIGPVSILFNNAGATSRLSLLDATAESVNKVLQTNITGPILCIREAVKSMLKNNINDGHIINNDSIVAHLPPTPPLPSVIYSASKHGLRIVSEGLRQELFKKNTNIKVTNLSPGAAETDILGDVELDYKMKPEVIADVCVACLSQPPDIAIHQLTISSVREPSF